MDVRESKVKSFDRLKALAGITDKMMRRSLDVSRP
jgi:hypothetical protein